MAIGLHFIWSSFDINNKIWAPTTKAERALRTSNAVSPQYRKLKVLPLDTLTKRLKWKCCTDGLMNRGGHCLQERRKAIVTSLILLNWLFVWLETVKLAASILQDVWVIIKHENNNIDAKDESNCIFEDVGMAENTHINQSLSNDLHSMLQKSSGIHLYSVKLSQKSFRQMLSWLEQWCRKWRLRHDVIMKSRIAMLQWMFNVYI